MQSDIRTETAPSPAKRLHDTRGFWRILLAIIAPLPMLAQGLYYLFSTVDGDASFRDTAAAYAANPSLSTVLTWLDAVFVVGLVPATIAVAWAARRGAPRLTTAGAVVALGGFFAGFGIMDGPVTTPLIAVRHHLDIDAIAKLDDAAEHEALLGVGALLFIVGVVIGLALLGIALWRSRVAPAWMGIALALGGFTHPFLPGHVAQGIGLLVAAVGFAGASVALLRLRNAEFDLPPVPAT
jgi:Domain of unknown function (DUF4386)